MSDTKLIGFTEDEVKAAELDRNDPRRQAAVKEQEERGRNGMYKSGGT